MKVCILGAGPTGLGAAHRLTELGVTDFGIFEQKDHAGGLAASWIDPKGFTWDLGVHVIHSHYSYVDKLLDTVLPNGYYQHQRRAWVRQYERYIPYPFQYNIRHLPREELWECVNGLLEIMHGNGHVPPANFEEWVVNTFGTGIARHFMLPYNRKIWTTDPREMTYHWIGERVPVVDVKRVLSNVILGTDDVSWGPNSTFQFPKHGGTGAIWTAMAAHLAEGTLHLNHEAVQVDADRKTVTFGNGRKQSYEHLISTIPLPVLTRMCGQGGLEQRAGQLRHTRVYVLGVAPARCLPEDLADKTWLYCPSSKVPFYRLTPFSTFSPAHVPSSSDCCSMLTERALPADQRVSLEQLKSETLAGLNQGGIMDVNPETTHTYAIEAEHAYPIPTLDRDDILADVLPALEQKAIYSRGRFGGWKYEAANMDHCIMQGVEVIDRILSGAKEKTLPTPALVNANGNGKP